MYLLDTTVLIDVSRRRQAAVVWLSGALRGSEQVCISAVSVAEFFAGLHPEHRLEWQNFVDELTHWDVTKDIAMLAGGIRYDLARRGRVIEIPDALIAATAMAYGAQLVTANIRDFAETAVATILLSS